MKKLLLLLLVPVFLQAQTSRVRHLGVDSTSYPKTSWDALIYREAARKLHIKSHLTIDSTMKVGTVTGYDDLLQGSYFDDTKYNNIGLLNPPTFTQSLLNVALQTNLNTAQNTGLFAFDSHMPLGDTLTYGNALEGDVYNLGLGHSKTLAGVTGYSRVDSGTVDNLYSFWDGGNSIRNGSVVQNAVSFYTSGPNVKTGAHVHRGAGLIVNPASKDVGGTLDSSYGMIVQGAGGGTYARNSFFYTGIVEVADRFMVSGQIMPGAKIQGASAATASIFSFWVNPQITSTGDQDAYAFVVEPQFTTPAGAATSNLIGTRFEVPSISIGSGANVYNASTITIAGAPTGTYYHPWAININAGDCVFNGKLSLGVGSSALLAPDSSLALKGGLSATTGGRFGGSVTAGSSVAATTSITAGTSIAAGTKIAVGTATEFIHSLAIGGTDTLTSIHLTRTDKNTDRTTYAKSIDTSSMLFRFTGMGKPYSLFTGPTGGVVACLDSNGNFGLGTSNPSSAGMIGADGSRLDIVSDVGGNGIRVYNSSSTGMIKFGEWGSVGTRFYPELAFNPVGSSSVNARISVHIAAGEDGGTMPLMSFVGQRIGAALVTRPIFSVSNYTGPALMQVGANGTVAIGTSAPTTTVFEVMSADDAVNTTLFIKATDANVTASDVFINFSDSTGIAGSIAGTAVPGVIAFNTFTGAHYAQKQVEADTILRGMIVSATGKFNGKELLPTIKRSGGRNDKAVYGVMAGKIASAMTVAEIQFYKSNDSLDRIKNRKLEKLQFIKDSLDLLVRADSISKTLSVIQSGDTLYWYNGADLIRKFSVAYTSPAPDSLWRNLHGKTLGFSKGNPRKDLYQVFALGTGDCLVTDTGGNIEVGDLIASSPLSGYGERQADDIVHSYTVAKSVQAVDWSTVVAVNGVKSVLVAVTYK